MLSGPELRGQRKELSPFLVFLCVVYAEKIGLSFGTGL